MIHIKTISFYKTLVLLLTCFLVPVISVHASPTLLAAGGSDTLIFSLFLGAIIFLAIIIYVLGRAIVQISKNKSLWEKKWNKASVVILFLLANLFSENAFAQEEVSQPLIRLSENAIYFLSFIVFAMFGIVLVLFSALNKLLAGLKEEPSAEELQKVEEKPSVLEVISQKLTDVVPIEKEEDLLFDHEYDGIRELDNNLPPWWKYGFYLTIVIAVVYLFHFHIFKTGDLSIAEYEKDMRIAEANVAAYLKTKADNVDEFSVVVLNTSDKLESGKKIWKQNCVSCHGEGGQGGIGPNMVDKYWIHGGDIKNIFKTIKYGVPLKGMQEWKTVLSPVQMQEVASYLLTFQGTNPEGQKDAEGELYVPVKEEVKDSAAAEI